jgi:signal peptidase I
MPTEPEQDVVDNHSKKPAKAADFWVETAKTIGISVILALALRQFVAQAFFIPTGSMEPTLLVDDRVLVDRVSYRFTDPQRGDIVVFDPTAKLQEMNYKEAFIKRVIGLPGDTVQVQDDKVTITAVVK